MIIENKLGIASEARLAEVEERITKQKALALFDEGLLPRFHAGTSEGLYEIHAYLFSDIYDFAGKLRTVNIARGTFRFVPVLCLEHAMQQIDEMPLSTFEDIVEKYVEMNVAHPFREGNGRSMRLWLDAILRFELGAAVDWSKVDRIDYLRAMERSPVWDLEIKTILKPALTERMADREIFMRGVDASWAYEASTRIGRLSWLSKTGDTTRSTEDGCDPPADAYGEFD